MKKKVLRLKNLGFVLGIAALSHTSCFAQLAANTYQFTAISGTFTEITGGTGVSTIQTDDATSAALPIGFTFNYCGTDYTQLKACSNGWLTFNTSLTTSSLTNGGTYTNTIYPAVVPLWDDLSGASGTASYITTGTAPNRIFTMQYKNWLWNYGASSPSISFQVKLYESTNIIQFIYRQESGSGNSSGSSGASIGIIDNTSPTQGYLSLNNTTASPTASSTTFTDNLTTRPATGQVYQFRPLPAIDMNVDTLFAANAPFCSNSNQPVSARISNNGTATINTVDIYWSVDGVAQPVVTYNTTPIGNIVSGNNKVDVVLGNVFFPDTNPRSIKAWTYQPNGLADEVPANDTATDPVLAGLPGIVLDLNPKDTTICQNATITLDAGTFPNNPIYIWSTGSLNESISVSGAGTYSVKVMNSYGCFDRDTVNVSVYPDPVINSIAIIDNGNGSFTFNMIGAQNVTYYVWNFGDGSDSVSGTITGQQQLHSFAPGTYIVTLTLYNDCGQIVATRQVEVGSTGIGTITALQKELKVYPNPAKAIVTVSSFTGDLKIKGVQLYNLVGQQVFEAAGDKTADKQTFDVSGLAAGIYNVVIDTDKGKAVKKLEVIK